MRRKKILILLSLVIVAGVVGLYAYPILNPVHVDTARAERGNLYVTVKASGQVSPKELVPVLAPASAKVVSVAVSLGQEVKKGDPLMDIEIVTTDLPASFPEGPAAPAPPSSPTPAPRSEATRPPATPPVPQEQAAPAPSPSASPSPPVARPSLTPEKQSAAPVLPSSTATVEVRPSPGVSPSPSPTQAPSLPEGPPADQGRAQPQPSPSREGPAGSTTYTVRPGDTLWDIAQQNGTTVEDIARASGISNPDAISPGQQVTIPKGRPGQGGSFAAPLPVIARVISTIASPIDGQVMRLEARADQLVAPQAPLVVLADTSSLFLEALIDQADLPGISKGQAAQTVIDALPKATITGKVEEINPVPATGALGASGYPVRVGLESPPKGIRLGMTGQAEIITRQLSKVLFVSKRAVLERRDEAFVFVIEGDRAQRVTVKLGQKTRDYYEIAGGLVDGQQIAVTKLDEIEDGKRVVVDRIIGPK